MGNTVEIKSALNRSMRVSDAIRRGENPEKFRGMDRVYSLLNNHSEERSQSAKIYGRNFYETTHPADLRLVKKATELLETGVISVEEILTALIEQKLESEKHFRDLQEVLSDLPSDQ